MVYWQTADCQVLVSQWYLGNCSFSVFRGLTCNLCLLGTRYWCSLNLRSQGSKAGALLSRCPIRSLRLYSGLCMYLCLYGCVRAHMFVRLSSVMLEYTWPFESFSFTGQSSLCLLDPNPQCPLMDRTMTLQVHTLSHAHTLAHAHTLVCSTEVMQDSYSAIVFNGKCFRNWTLLDCRNSCKKASFFARSCPRESNASIFAFCKQLCTT